MSFDFTNAEAALGEITYKKKKLPPEQEKTPGEAEIEGKDIRIGKHRESGLHYIVMAFSIQLDTPAFFLYAEGVFKAEISGVSSDLSEDKEYRRKVVQFAHNNHQRLIEKEVEQVIDNILSLTVTPPSLDW